MATIKTLIRLGLSLTLAWASRAQAQVAPVYVPLVQTGAGYAAADTHYVLKGSAPMRNQLVLFIGGSGSRPLEYAIFCQYAASLGFDVISLAYPNAVPAASLGATADSLALTRYRQEVCFGTQQSGAVNVDTLNSIYTRAVNLIRYLGTVNPAGSWQQYLASPTTLNWSRVLVAGHSQGSGHAAFLAKSLSVARVVMFSGPNDYSTFYNRAGAWLRTAGVTPASRHFALLHLQDEVVPFAYQYANNAALGLLQTRDTVWVDRASAPYGNARVLYTQVPALSYHAASVGAHPGLPAVWNYMLTSALTVATEPRMPPHVPPPYPNPTAGLVSLHLRPDSLPPHLTDLAGRVLPAATTRQASVVTLDLRNYPAGIYLLHSGNRVFRVVKE